MDAEGVPACSSSNSSGSSNSDSIVMESGNIYAKIVEAINADAAPLAGTSKNVLSIERMSPASVDSGFDSSFPSSPDCSLDSPVSAISGTEITKCKKNPSLNRQHRITTTTNASGVAATTALSQHNDITGVPQCSLSLCQPSCSSSPLAISRTSSNISTASTLSTNISLSADGKSAEDLCTDVCLLEKTASLAASSSSLLSMSAVDVHESQDLEVLSASTPSDSSSTGPLTECSTVPSSSTSITAEAEVNELELRVPCRWKNCTERFACDNNLYDHVVKAHLEPLRPSECLNGSISNGDKNNGAGTGGGAAGGGGGGGGCAGSGISGSSSGSGSQSPMKGRLKNLMCQWGSCEMGLSRGDVQKQFIWLEEHFTTRHAGKAQPYRCLIAGCSSRFTLKRLLEEHLRTGHEKAKTKRPHTEEGELSRVKSCFQWTPLPYYIPNENNDFLDRATEEWIVMRLRQYERTKGACFVAREPATPRGGAAYRKRRRILTFAIEPRKTPPKVISDTMKLADAKKLIKSAFSRAEDCTKSSAETTITNGS